MAPAARRDSLTPAEWLDSAGKLYVADTGNSTIRVGSLRAQLANISTRAQVGTGDNVILNGFTITGSFSKKVLLRAIGPSVPVADALADTTLDLIDSSGTRIGYNDDWKDSQQAEIQATGIPPSNDKESAIVATLAPGTYYGSSAAKAARPELGWERCTPSSTCQVRPSPRSARAHKC